MWMETVCFEEFYGAHAQTFPCLLLINIKIHLLIHTCILLGQRTHRDLLFLFFQPEIMSHSPFNPPSTMVSNPNKNNHFVHLVLTCFYLTILFQSRAYYVTQNLKELVIINAHLLGYGETIGSSVRREKHAKLQPYDHHFVLLAFNI